MWHKIKPFSVTWNNKLVKFCFEIYSVAKNKPRILAKQKEVKISITTPHDLDG